MFRLIILMGMGLGALYMLHLLAQDYNKIRQPVAAAARALTSASATLGRNKRETNPHPINILNLNANSTGMTIDWKRILSRDPFECLQSLICQLLAGADEYSEEAIALIDFVESSIVLAPAKISRAFSRGLALRGLSGRCYEEYPFCVYSAKTMLRVLKWFTETTTIETQQAGNDAVNRVRLEVNNK